MTKQKNATGITGQGDAVVRLSEMWAWWNNKDKDFSMIYKSENLVRMCSPDGFDKKEKNGEGKVIKVVVSEA